MANVDYLTEDNILPDNQKFVCISFLTKPKNSDDQDNSNSAITEKDAVKGGVKVRGVFSTYELACSHAKKIQSIDPYFNVFVGDMGKWLEFDPIKESEYANEELNNMMKGYLENQEKAKIFHEHRKNELVRNNILDNLNTRKDNLEDLKKKLTDAQTDDEKLKIENSVKSVEDQVKILNDKKTNLDKQIEELDLQLKSFKQCQPVAPKIINSD